MAGLQLPLGNFQLGHFAAERPLHGYPEQFLAVSVASLAADAAKTAQDANEDSAAVKHILACLGSMRSAGLLRNLVASCTIFNKLSILGR